jgi:hypothetical protein
MKMAPLKIDSLNEWKHTKGEPLLIEKGDV